MVDQPPPIAAKEQTTMDDFKKGSIVELKSGGPPMTIHEIDPDGRVYCLWFHGNKKDTGAFEPETLKLLPEQGR